MPLETLNFNGRVSIVSFHFMAIVKGIFMTIVDIRIYFQIFYARNECIPATCEVNTIFYTGEDHLLSDIIISHYGRRIWNNLSEHIPRNLLFLVLCDDYVMKCENEFANKQFWNFPQRLRRNIVSKRVNLCVQQRDRNFERVRGKLLYFGFTNIQCYRV